MSDDIARDRIVSDGTLDEEAATRTAALGLDGHAWVRLIAGGNQIARRSLRAGASDAPRPSRQPVAGRRPRKA
jgi:hypothetical protein